MTSEERSALPELNSINDLKKVPFGQSVPKHSLLLLHWFTNNINIDPCNTITLTFDPSTDFGSHHYGNYEDVLDKLPRGYQYYTVGNLNADRSNELAAYILNPPVKAYQGNNKDRIVFSAEEQNSGIYRINRVYLTQHQGLSNAYDPEHTYRISTKLLQQINEFSSGNLTCLRRLRDQFHSDISNSQIQALKNEWGDLLVCLGLMLFIVIQEKYIDTNNSMKTLWTCFCVMLVVVVRVFLVLCVLVIVFPLPSVAIAGHDAYIQIFTKQHKACARLYVNFAHWRFEFVFSWVGFYSSIEKSTYQYEIGQWQWVNKFNKIGSDGEYNVFEYCSDMEASPWVHVRFIKNFREIAYSPPKILLEIVHVPRLLYNYTKGGITKLMKYVEQRNSY